MADDLLIAVLPKNGREDFRVQLRTFRDQRRIDLRIFASNGVDRVATPKGVSIGPADIRAVINALEQAEAAARDEGLIPEGRNAA